MIKIAFLGDIAFNGEYMKLYESGINPFKSLEGILGKVDYVAGNLECMCNGNSGENLLKKPRLTTNLETLNFLKDMHLKLAFLAQNHVYDHLENGFSRTLSFLEENNIKYMGSSLALENSKEPQVINQNGINVGILNYVTKDTNPNLPKDSKLFLNVFELDTVCSEISDLKKKVDHVVLSLHWGGRVEGGLYPDWDQSRIAKRLVDAGADLIVGHHSHTVQPYEVYKGKYIFYSLGNFCFSNFWFEGKYNPMANRRMITFIPKISFQKNSYSVECTYYRNNISTFEKINYTSKHKIRNTCFKNILSIKFFWEIYYLYQKKLYPILVFFGRKDLSMNEKITRFVKALKRKL